MLDKSLHYITDVNAAGNDDDGGDNRTKSVNKSSEVTSLLQLDKQNNKALHKGEHTSADELVFP